jgi:hypothetical protein
MLHYTHRAILKFAFLSVLVYPATVFAEVSEKEPSADLFWKIGLAAAIICLVGARVKPWLGVTCFVPVALSNKALLIFYRHTRLSACRCVGYSRAMSGIEKARPSVGHQRYGNHLHIDLR